eukprot:scaffold12177_cov114-Isochrysis_galbana.AAC.1
MGNAGAMRMSRADSALLARAGEDHLGIGTHERDGDSGTPLELTLDDRPDGIPSVLGLLDLLTAHPRACRRRPGRQAPGPTFCFGCAASQRSKKTFGKVLSKPSPPSSYLVSWWAVSW